MAIPIQVGYPDNPPVGIPGGGRTQVDPQQKVTASSQIPNGKAPIGILMATKISARSQGCRRELLALIFTARLLNA